MRGPTSAPTLGLEGIRVHDLRHHAATVIARNPDVTLRELMATIGHSSHVAALRYQHSTAERSRAIADYPTASSAPRRVRRRSLDASSRPKLRRCAICVP